MQEVYDFLKKCGTYYLATADGDQPRVRPFGSVNVYEGRLYFQTGKGKDVAGQIIENPKIEICAYNGDRWIRVRAVAVEDDRFAAKKHILDSHPGLRERFSANEDNTSIFYLKDAVATICSFSSEPKVIKF